MAIEAQVYPNNSVGEVFSSAARTASPTAVTITNNCARGIEVVINVTAASATPSVVFTISSVDRTTGAVSAILTSAAVTGTGVTRLRVYPGIAASANVSASDIIGREIQISAAHADSDSITYQVGFTLLP